MIGRLLRADIPAAQVEARWGGPPSTFVEVEGLRTRYRDQGQGPGLVLLHGSYASLDTWEGWRCALSPSHRVVALDLPGHGLTGPDVRGRYAPTAMADFVAAFASQIGLEGFALAGNSMGGRVAAEIALRHPARVQALILVDAAGLPDAGVPWTLRFFESALADPVVRWVTPRSAIRRAMRGMYGDPSRVTGAAVERFEALMLREGNRGAARASLRGGGEVEFERRLADVRAPTLILWGTLDRMIPARHAHRFAAKISGSRVVLLEGLGHLPMEEDPARTAAEVRRFLDELRLR
jgi:pimeloyl-ACP methyl ester carboxylesterase